MTTNNQTTPNRFLQANLALALAVIPSYLIFTLMPKPIMQAFDLWRQGLQLSIRYDALMGVGIYWWLPALLIFILMVFTNFERWLKVNLLAHLSIFIANLFMFLVIGLIVYHNDHMYALTNMRDAILFNNLMFAAVVTLANMVWHYVIAPNPKLQACLSDDVANRLLK